MHLNVPLHALLLTISLPAILTLADGCDSQGSAMVVPRDNADSGAKEFALPDAEVARDMSNLHDGASGGDNQRPKPSARGGTGGESAEPRATQSATAPAWRGIELVVFDDDTERTPTGVLLFEDGMACLDLEFVVQGDDEITHQKKFPSDWRKWRRTGTDRIEFGSGNSVTPFQYAGVFPPLRRGTTFDDVDFEDKGVIGEFIFERHFLFHRDGSFKMCEYLAPPKDYVKRTDRTGTYAMDGFVLQLTYKNGDREDRSIVALQADSPDSVWLNEIRFTKVPQKSVTFAEWIALQDQTLCTYLADLL